MGATPSAALEQSLGAADELGVSVESLAIGRADPSAQGLELVVDAGQQVDAP